MGRSRGPALPLAALLLLVAALLLIACGGLSATAAPGRACAPVAARTVARDAAVWVYAVGSTDYACATATGQIHRLGSGARCVGTPRVGPFALGGPYLVYGEEVCGVDAGSASVTELTVPGFHLRSRASGFPVELGPESYTRIRSIVVGASGSAAWIISGRSIIHRGPTQYGVYLLRAGPGGAGVGPVDEGTGIDPGSLRLSGTRLSWRDGGRTRIATLR
jgi:hypothetical protein